MPRNYTYSIILLTVIFSSLCHSQTKISYGFTLSDRIVMPHISYFQNSDVGSLHDIEGYLNGDFSFLSPQLMSRLEVEKGPLFSFKATFAFSHMFDPKDNYDNRYNGEFSWNILEYGCNLGVFTPPLAVPFYDIFNVGALIGYCGINSLVRGQNDFDFSQNADTLLNSKFNSNNFIIGVNIRTRPGLSHVYFDGGWSINPNMVELTNTDKSFRYMSFWTDLGFSFKIYPISIISGFTIDILNEESNKLLSSWQEMVFPKFSLGLHWVGGNFDVKQKPVAKKDKYMELEEMKPRN